MARGGRRGGGERGGRTPARTAELGALSGAEGCGMRGVAVKCIDIAQNPDCEGGKLDSN